MFAQNLFFYTASITFIIIALAVLLLSIFWLVVLNRFARLIKKTENSLDTLREKIKISSLIALFVQGTKEVISFIRERRKGKEEKEE